VSLPQQVLADGHAPADGLATIDVPATALVIAEDGRHLTIWLESSNSGPHPVDWRTVRGRTLDGARFSADCSDMGTWHAAISFDGQPLNVDTIRRLRYDDCGGEKKVLETEIDGTYQHLCAGCREKWGGYLDTTFSAGGGRDD
jgi:hypothetical protein